VAYSGGAVRRGERITTIQRSARTIAEMSFADADLVLRQFGFDTGQVGDFESHYAYAVWMLEHQDDDASLAELDAHLHPDPAAGVDVARAGDDGPWAAGAFRLFVSHTSEHKQRAANLAGALDRYGVDAFVAHDDIEPTREWQQEIDGALRSCDALCAILTPDFVASLWCDQEIGFAVALHKPIVALRVGADPHGFIGKYQGASLVPKASATGVADQLLRALVRNPLTAEHISPAIVRRYVRAGSYDGARSAWELLQVIPKAAWTPDMVEQVERAPAENDQIQNAVLSDGKGTPIPDVAAALLREVRGESEPAPVADDEIPF
jgi:TIR domain